jgi:hypothetical protein
MHLPVSYINPSDCRRVIVTLSNSDELFAYYVGEDSDTNMHNVYLVKFGSMLDFILIYRKFSSLFLFS